MYRHSSRRQDARRPPPHRAEGEGGPSKHDGTHGRQHGPEGSVPPLGRGAERKSQSQQCRGQGRRGAAGRQSSVSFSCQKRVCQRADSWSDPLCCYETLMRCLRRGLEALGRGGGGGAEAVKKVTGRGGGGSDDVSVGRRCTRNVVGIAEALLRYSRSAQLSGASELSLQPLSAGVLLHIT